MDNMQVQGTPMGLKGTVSSLPDEERCILPV